MTCSFIARCGVQSSARLLAWRTLESAQNGELFADLLCINAIQDDEGNVTGYVGISSDITERKNSEERLNFLAYHDTLTGLPNRILLNERLGRALRARQRQEKLQLLTLITLKP